MSQTLTLTENLQESVLVTDSEAAPTDPTLTYDASSWIVPTTLTASTTPPITKIAKGTLTMSVGAGTIDLTACAHSVGTIDFSGLKIQRVVLKGPTTNANKVTVAKGASNGYGLDAASGTWQAILDPGAYAIVGIADSAPDVDGTHKTIDVSGTGSQTLQYIIIGG